MPPAFEPEALLRVFLIFVRIGGVLAAAPFFSSREIPARVKVFFALLMAFALSGVVPGALPAYATQTVGLALAVAVEAVTGLAIGFAGQLVFWAVQFAGEVIGFQVGLSLSQAYDPSTGGNTNAISRLLGFTFLLLFLLMDGHHQVLLALTGSFRVVPLAGANLAATGPFLLTWTGGFVATAMRLSAPFLVTLAIVDVSMAVFARVVPQADLFALGVPLKLLLGLGVLFVYVQQFIPVVPGLVDAMTGDVLRLLEVLATP